MFFSILVFCKRYPELHSPVRSRPLSPLASCWQDEPDTYTPLHQPPCTAQGPPSPTGKATGPTKESMYVLRMARGPSKGNHTG